MMTIITRVKVKAGKEAAWDAAMRERLQAVHGRPGWVAAQILIPLDQMDRRVIVGTWQSRADWEAWHSDPSFAESRKNIDELERDSGNQDWFETIVDQRVEN